MRGLAWHHVRGAAAASLLVLGSTCGAAVLMATVFIFVSGSFTARWYTMPIAVLGPILLAGYLVQVRREQLQKLRAYAAADAADGLSGQGGSVAAPTPDVALSRLISAAIDRLPPEFRSQLTNIAVVFEDEPPDGKPWLATYSGIPLPRQSVWHVMSWPHRITIYRGPLSRLCDDDPDKLAAEVEHVIRHELAHYFGITDERLIEIDRY